MSGTIGSATQANQVAQAANSQRTRLNANFDTFLTLLTTQLRNQDPTRAMDTQQMTQQLTQFAAVEQQLALNESMNRLITLQQGAQVLAAAPVMGRVVEVESDQVSLQDGAAALRLPAAGMARRAGIEVIDGAGRIVRTAEVALGAAERDWRWDGRDNAGQRLADGPYRVRVRGLAQDGTETALSHTVLGRATAVERADGEVKLRLGGLTVDFARLRSIVGG